ncbi:hypothetical protein K9N68_17670 [Kovacikia minuta CCNUW1]|uniref:hypothetical protein n=1 Tax=Kovacikia minuta TaxID=2931930 RepID=UPI001CCE0FDD|nr:hypothetical protein [Kovacikia minuta]UBF23609.1 hypothetical protein K9N68_17670 [Kovacikia minuta CCNUW1]
MTTQPEYTETELETLRQAVIMSGHAVVFCEFAIVSMGIEIATLGKEITGAVEKHPDSQLIQTLFAKYANGKEPQEKEEPQTEVSPDAILESAVSLIRKALAILEKKATPAEIQEYKEFTYGCANSVAHAAGEGLFGIGDKVSKKEAATLNVLKTTLGL